MLLYQELIQRFWDLNQKAHLGSTAIAMYLYLLKLGNDNGGYDITISDSEISDILGLTRKTVRPTKEKLRSFGLIQYQNKNGLPCSYILLPNYAIKIPEREKARKGSPKRKWDASIVEKDKDVSSLSVSLQNIDEIPSPQVEIPPVDSLKHHFKAADVPSLEEFIAYAQTLEGYEALSDSEIEKKYLSWTGNSWRNGADRPITNWKSSLKSTLPYMINKADSTILSIESIPDIKRPKSPDEKQ